MTKSSSKTKSRSLDDELEQRIARSRNVALRVAQAGMEKKAVGIEIIDVVGKIDYADFLVLMTGTSDRHCGALADEVERSLTNSGDKPMGVEGKGSWILLDFFDVVVHVFSEDARDLYDLSGLWMDAGRVPVPVRPTEKIEA